MDAQKIAASNSAEQKLATSVQQTLEDQQGLASALTTLQQAQTVADSKQQAVNDDLAAMQGRFDILVAAAIAIGLQVNLPSPPTSTTVVNPPPDDSSADTTVAEATGSEVATESEAPAADAQG